MQEEKIHRQDEINSIKEQIQQQQVQKLVDQDPYGPSYHQSAIKYLPYRIGIVVVAVFFIVLGKSSLPSDQVPCIQDAILDALQPVTDFYIKNQSVGVGLMSLMQLIVDIQLVGMLIFWFLIGDSMRYPIVLTIIGVAKIFLNGIFQTKLIQNSFTKQAFPSIVFGQNFMNTYFFSGVTCLLLTNLFQFREKNYKILFWAQLVTTIIISFLLLSMRQNFFMDIATAGVFTHYFYYFINDRIKTIDSFVIKIYQKLVGNGQEYKQEQNQIN